MTRVIHTLPTDEWVKCFDTIKYPHNVLFTVVYISDD